MYFITIRAPHGTLLHVTRSHGDVTGFTLCGRAIPGWTIEPDASATCIRCLQAMTRKQ